MMLQFGLKEDVIERIRAVFARHPQVEKAVLYGSRSKGTYKNGSDIDLTLYGGDDLTRHVLFRIMDELDDLMLPYSFDLSIFSHIGDMDVIGHIERVGITLYEKGKSIS